MPEPERYFEEHHRAELKDVFTRLADFIHKHKLKQIVGAGPSAQPYAVAVARAYTNRHGENLRVVNLGKVGELTLKQEWRDPAVFKKYLLSQRKLDLEIPSFLFDELAVSGRDLTLYLLCLLIERNLQIFYLSFVRFAASSAKLPTACRKLESVKLVFFCYSAAV